MTINPDAVDVINRMIQLDPKARLGSTPESMALLKQHPFFKDIDFEMVSNPKF